VRRTQAPDPFAPLNPDRPLLLLDVDGVLNPLSLHRPDAWPDFEQADVHGYDLWLSEEMGRALSRVNASVAWCTTWCDDPRGLVEIARYMGGLCPLWMGSWGNPFSWKSAMVAHALERFSLVIWIDDDERFEPSPHNLMRITPNAFEGLHPEDINRMHARIADNSQPKVATNG